MADATHGRFISIKDKMPPDKRERCGVTIDASLGECNHRIAVKQRLTGTCCRDDSVCTAGDAIVARLLT
jgi:hypothetical protein